MRWELGMMNVRKVCRIYNLLYFHFYPVLSAGLQVEMAIMNTMPEANSNNGPNSEKIPPKENAVVSGAPEAAIPIIALYKLQVSGKPTTAIEIWSQLSTADMRRLFLK
ncbi:MAG: hypothetical protein JST26_09425 [Bacteroidetes bacterium]|nr:hypothetical protein [Bacteroidota bacterium]